MLKRSSFHTYSRTETFPPLIDCVVDNALLETMPDIDQTLLQFIDVMNLLNWRLNFFTSFAVSQVQNCATWWRKV